MIPTVRVAEVGRHVGQDVRLRGWLYNRRSKGKLHFLIVRDGSGLIQAVMFAGDVDPETFARADHLGQESSLELVGTVRADPRAPGGHELAVKALAPIQPASDYPISPKEHGIDFLMQNRHLWLRSSRQHAILRIRATIEAEIRRFLDRDGFVLIDSPILTGNAAEGTSTLFSTEYFDQTAYLSQSGQLYAEAAAMAFGKVYCFGPTFRAEKSKTRRHLTEFWMVEPEMAFFDLDDSMALQERFVSHIVKAVLASHGEELRGTLERDTAPLEKVEPPFPRISYEDALGILKSRGEELAWGEDFGGGHETIIAEQFETPFFVDRFPTITKAFYMKPDPERPELALCADMLAPEGYGEIIGGSQRIDDLALLERRIDEHGLSRDAFAWYLDLRRYGSVPHSGFGMGVERLVAWICGLHHLRETIPFARTIDRLYP
ncbi:MAG TPA: asparagine--tRNA ligase [Chloroflexota bacterium]